MSARVDVGALVNRKATTGFLKAFYDAARLASDANRIEQDMWYVAQQREHTDRSHVNFERSKPGKRKRTLVDTSTGAQCSVVNVLENNEHWE